MILCVYNRETGNTSAAGNCDPIHVILFLAPLFSQVGHSAALGSPARHAKSSLQGPIAMPRDRWWYSASKDELGRAPGSDSNTTRSLGKRNQKHWSCWMLKQKWFIVGLVGCRLWIFRRFPSNHGSSQPHHQSSFDNTWRAPRRSCLASKVKAAGIQVFPHGLCSEWDLKKVPHSFPHHVPFQFFRMSLQIQRKSYGGNDDQPSIMEVHSTGCHLCGIIQEIHVGLADCRLRTFGFPSQVS